MTATLSHADGDRRRKARSSGELRNIIGKTAAQLEQLLIWLTTPVNKERNAHWS